MKAQYNSITFVVPALNEEKTVRNTVNEIISVLEKNSIEGEIILVNDGSNDDTGRIADEIADSNHCVKVVHHKQPMGIGCCFREGVEKASKKAVTWLPGDGENDPYEIVKYISLLEHVDIVNPFVINPTERPFLRRFLSQIYLLIVNLLFGTSFHYTNGNVLYRREVFDQVKNISNGFFYQTECLVKAVRAGFIFAEVPVVLKKRKEGRSKALSPKSIYNVFKEFIRVFADIYFTSKSTTQSSERLS